jgi:putative DNA primase/helicase
VQPELTIVKPDRMSIPHIQTRVIEDVKKEQAEFDPEMSELQPYLDAISRSIGISDFLSRKLPKLEWLVEQLMYLGQLIMLFAKAGVGKTWFALSLALAISQGKKLFGPFSAPRPVAVLYVDGEMSASELQERLKSLCTDAGECGLLQILSSELLAQEGFKTPNLSDPKCREAFLRYVKDKPDIRFVVLDNISSLTPGMSEQERIEWDDVNQWLLAMRRLGLTVLLIHHAGKGGDQRGTSAREDQLDLVLKLTKVEGRKIPTFKVEFQKARSLTADQKKPFLVEIVEHQNGKITLQHKLVAEDDLAQVAFLVSMGLPQKEIGKRLGIAQGTVSKKIAKARDQKLLQGNVLTECGEACCAGMSED